MKILIGKSLEAIWRKHKHAFVQYYIKEGAEKILHTKDLVYRFHDKQGKAYFGFPESLPLPLERWGKARDFLQWMSVGVSVEEFNNLITLAEKNWLSYIKTGKNAAKVGYIFEELRTRSSMVLHTELLYNYVAVLLVREDESAIHFNAEVHNEKVAQLKREMENGNSNFFFALPELNKLNKLLNFSYDDWQTYWTESEVKQQLLKKVMQTILSESEQQSVPTTSHVGL